MTPCLSISKLVDYYAWGTWLAPNLHATLPPKKLQHSPANPTVGGELVGAGSTSFGGEVVGGEMTVNHRTWQATAFFTFATWCTKPFHTQFKPTIKAKFLSKLCQDWNCSQLPIYYFIQVNVFSPSKLQFHWKLKHGLGLEAQWLDLLPDNIKPNISLRRQSKNFNRGKSHFIFLLNYLLVYQDKMSN